jgi:hypothetical protein
MRITFKKREMKAGWWFAWRPVLLFKLRTVAWMERVWREPAMDDWGQDCWLYRPAPQVKQMHPHPDPKHVMRAYRGYILGCKRKWGYARGLIHYRGFVETYLWAKRQPVQQPADTGKL